MNDEARRDRGLGLVTGAQIRAARGLLNLSVLELAERTGLALNTVRRAEATNDVAPITNANARLLVTTLEAAGVVFIPADELGPGVRLRDAAQAPLQRRRTVRPPTSESQS